VGIFGKDKDTEIPKAIPPADRFADVPSGTPSTPPPPAQAGPVPIVAAMNTYVVAKGDSLSRIAQRAYGDGNKWRKIYEANKDVIKDPDLIYPGQSLTIPE
jgi:nucleoid-associated protein YgaU